MEETLGVTGAGTIPSQQRGQPLPDTAVRYTEDRHWDVVPGVWLETAGGVERCSCGDRGCPAPGAHPADKNWATQATGSASVARELWAERPTAAILLPTGRSFDAIEVPETAGFLALARMERMGMTPGPVTRAPDRRMRFLVLPGGARKAGDLVRGLGWSPRALGLKPLAEGAWIAAPPTRVGGQGTIQWARHPTPANRWLPTTEELINPLAYACGREPQPTS
ncbi:bifunctional DNA primase/polymerase [Streptomyces sp. NPDC004959]|uniref:bifunctional DNA primase/polymerase n=1 Tax=unclassified Streptomyces TaxID=2593676 RepID=UPI0033B5AD09